jgi:hypothetical protein
MRLLAKGVPNFHEKQRRFTKKGCCCSFTLKKFYFHSTIAKISYPTIEQVNKLGLIVHGNVKFGYKLTFLAHVSKETRSFVLENLCMGLFIYQVMNKHKYRIKEIMETNGDLLRKFFYVSKTFVTSRKGCKRNLQER